MSDWASLWNNEWIMSGGHQTLKTHGRLLFLWTQNASNTKNGFVLVCYYSLLLHLKCQIVLQLILNRISVFVCASHCHH